MFFLNLTLPEFLTIAGTLGGLITVLYFFDRSKRKKTVSSLRFWSDTAGAQQQQRRKSVRQPWSLLLQLLSVLLLLLAIARLQLGSRELEIRNTVLLLDTSSAAGEKSGAQTVLDREKNLALDYISRLPSRDRVMIVRAGGLASPAAPFVADRDQLRAAIAASHAGFSALDIGRALTYATFALHRASGVPAEVVYIGPARVAEQPVGVAVPRLRVLRVPAAQDNVGIRAISVERAEGDEAWNASVTLRNDGLQNRAVTLATQFSGTPFALRRLTIRPGGESRVDYRFVANSAGRLDFQLQPDDNLPADNRASVFVPVSRPAKVIVYSERPDAWRPLLDPDKSLDVRYQAIKAYSSHAAADVVVLDEFAPQARPGVPSLWVDVPAQGSPLPVKTNVTSQLVTQWNGDRELGAGLHARDLLLPRANIFQTFDTDFVVASTALGPVAVVRPASQSGPPFAEVGFDFLAGPLRYRVSSPILFANLMRWLAPRAFRAVQVSAEPVGLASVALDSGEQLDTVRVNDTEGNAIPFLIQNRTLQFFVESPTVVRITTGQRNRVLSMILPQVATEDWKPPAAVATSMPARSVTGRSASDLWQILACLGGFGLLLEWILFGGSGTIRLRPRAPATKRSFSSTSKKGELVAK
jgi:hypothetical protein